MALLNLSSNRIIGHGPLIFSRFATYNNISTWLHALCLKILNTRGKSTNIIFETSEPVKTVNMIKILGYRVRLLNCMARILLHPFSNPTSVLLFHISLKQVGWSWALSLSLPPWLLWGICHLGHTSTISHDNFFSCSSLVDTFQKSIIHWIHTLMVDHRF